MDPGGGVRLPSISLRTLPGACHASRNRHAVDWSARSNLVAVASNVLVVVVDPTNLQVAQVLDKHKALVTRVSLKSISNMI